MANNTVTISLLLKDQLTKGLKTSEKAINKFAKSSAIAFGSAMAASVVATAQFEDRLADVSTLISGDATGAIDEFRDGILRMSQSVPKSADELGASAYSIVSAGISDASQAMNVLESSAKLAVAGLGTTEEATDLMTSALNAYQFSADEANNISNILFKTVKNGKTTVAELAIGFGKVAPVAKSMNVSFEELQAVTAAVSTTGIKAAEVQTGLKAVLSNMIKPTKELEGVIRALGADSGKQLIETSGGLVPALEKVKVEAEKQGMQLGEVITSTEGLTIAESVLGAQSEILKSTLEDMRSGTDAVGEAFDKQADSAMKNYQVFKNNVNVILNKLGTDILPIVNDALKEFNDTLNHSAKMAAIAEKPLNKHEKQHKAIQEQVKKSTGVEREFLLQVEEMSFQSIRAYEALQSGNDTLFRQISARREQDVKNLRAWFAANEVALHEAGVSFEDWSADVQEAVSETDGRIAYFVQNSTEWGRHITENLAAGMQSAQPSLDGAINQVMNTIRRLEHSENPELNERQWGLHAIQNFAVGMLDAKGDLQLSLDEIIDLVHDFNLTQKKEFRVGAEGIIELQETYADAVTDIRSEIQSLTDDLDGIFSGFGEKEARRREKLANAIVDQEQNIAQIREDIAQEEDNNKREALREQLSREIEIRDENMNYINDLEKEVTEIRKFNSLSQLQQAVKVFQQEKIENQKWLEERLGAFDAELQKAKETMPEIEELFKIKRDKVLEYLGDEVAKNQELQKELNLAAGEVLDLIDKLNQLKRLRDELGYAVNVSSVFKPGVETPGPQNLSMGDVVGPLGRYITVNVTGNTLLDEDAGEKIGSMLMKELSYNTQY